MVSPITGELVPIEQMGEHMRISLIDPRSACTLHTHAPPFKTLGRLASTSVEG